MDLHRYLIFLYLACLCNAGPLVWVCLNGVMAIAADAGAVATYVTESTILSSILSATGIGPSMIWFDGFCIANGALYYGSAAVGAGVLAGVAGAGTAAGVSVKLTKDQEARVRADMSLLSSASVSLASAFSVSSVASVASVSSVSVVASSDRVSKASVISDVAQASKSAMRQKASQASLSASMIMAGRSSLVTVPSAKASGSRPLKVPGLPAPTTSKASQIKRSGPTANLPIPAPPGKPVKILPPDQQRQKLPPGVPEYNVRMCQNDIIIMGQKNQSLTFDNPSGYSLRVGNVPSTCMVLATVLVGDPTLGPHPIPMGAASLQWNDIKPSTMNMIRQAFGKPPI